MASFSASICCYFNPRPPRGGRHLRPTPFRDSRYFNPRPPRGGRRVQARGIKIHDHFNPRPPRGGRLISHFHLVNVDLFQSTPPARGATTALGKKVDVIEKFQSTPPARGATAARPEAGAGRLYFNPRPPRGGRQPGAGAKPPKGAFQSTPPARGATERTLERGQADGHFNPRPPRGGRQQKQPKFQAVFTTIRQFLQIFPPGSRCFPKIGPPACRKRRKLWCETAEISCALALRT